ncbi:GntR family transcriptional regulator [Streptomyces cacaoi]|uniref:GntR family transcriptional regulator n=1 Tax=Streptomyces cacaoi TaxID=1898 RepID=UPI00260266FD|nr:GntR family transcriptional regulator [Streptomyces cacaoi]
MAKVYEQIAEDFRRAIRTGELSPGDRLPTETALVEKYGKTLPTIRQALGLLQSEGLIEKRHGRGSFVRKPRKVVRRTNERHQWEKNRAREDHSERVKTGATEHDTGLQVDDLVFHAHYREVEANSDLAAVFGVPEGTTLVERNYRTRYRAEDAPFNMVTSYLVRDYVAANPDLLDDTKEPWPGGTMNQLDTVGIELGSIEERVTARPPTAEETDELKLLPGTSVLIVRKISRDIDGRPVEVSDLVLPGDRTEMTFITPLERW